MGMGKGEKKGNNARKSEQEEGTEPSTSRGAKGQAR